MLSSRHQTVFGKVTPQSLAGIVEAVEQGKLAPTIGRTVPLSEAIPAIIELEKPAYPRENWWSFPMCELDHPARIESACQALRSTYESFIHNISPVLTDARSLQ